MKLKDAIVLGIGFSIGKCIFNIVIQCIDKFAELGNEIIDTMHDENISFDESIDKVMNNRKSRKTKHEQKEKKNHWICSRCGRVLIMDSFFFAQNIQLL